MQIELERVQKKSGGRIHLAGPQEGPAHTLCGKVFQPDDYRRTEADADCKQCLRRSHDPVTLSAFLFEQDAGSRLLELSLEQARGQERPPPSERSRKAEEKADRPRFTIVRDEPLATPRPALTPAPAPEAQTPELVLEGPVEVERVDAQTIRLKSRGRTVEIRARSGRLELRD